MLGHDSFAVDRHHVAHRLGERHVYRADRNSQLHVEAIATSDAVNSSTSCTISRFIQEKNMTHTPCFKRPGRLDRHPRRGSRHKIGWRANTLG